MMKSFYQGNPQVSQKSERMDPPFRSLTKKSLGMIVEFLNTDWNYFRVLL